MHKNPLEKATSENPIKKFKNLNNNINNNDHSKDLFIIQNKLIFKKYQPIKQIGRGTFSTVYLASIVDTNKFVAIKAEKKSQNSVELLKNEAFLLYSLRGFGIPEVLSYGRTKTHNILVMPLLGKSLLDMFIIRPSPININDICISSLQILDRIEWVHANNIVYRDIKPENFLFGQKDSNVLYLIDFGLCRKYISSKTGKHISPKNLGKFTGTSRYASIYAMAGNEQSRRDDIESIGYMIIYFMKKKLPWQGIKGNSYKECYHKLYLMKKHMNLGVLCRGLPGEVLEYMKYAKSLKFEQEPNYKYLKNLFQIILNNNKINIDKYILSWCRQDINNNPCKDNEKNNALNENNEINNKKHTKLNSQNQPDSPNVVYKTIKENIDNKIKYTNHCNKEINKSMKNLTKCNKNTVINKNELNSEVSNTLKVLMSKNLQSLNNIGQNQSAGINLNLARINSEKNVYSDNFFLQEVNNNIKGFPQNYKKDQLMSFNQQMTDRNNYNIQSHSNIFNNKLNNTNQIKKITSISPIQKSNGDKVNNIFININNNNSKNKYNKITQIKITSKNPENNQYTKNNNNNTKENIIYNTYNTYNTYNSYNNINNINTFIDNNNSYLQSIYKREPSHIINYQNYNRIKKNNLQNNHLLNYIKSESFIESNQNKSNDVVTKNKTFVQDKFNSIDFINKNDSITGHFYYKKNQNQKDLNSYNINNIRKSNTSLNKNKIITVKPIIHISPNLDKNTSNNKIRHYNSYVIKTINSNNYSNNNSINHGKNNFLKITRHSNKKTSQIMLQKRFYNNIENRSYNINNTNNTNKIKTVYTNNKIMQNNTQKNKTLENHSYYINTSRYNANKNSFNYSYIKKNGSGDNTLPNQRSIKSTVNNDDKNKKCNKLIVSKMESLPPNHSLKIVKTSSRKRIENKENKLNDNNLNNTSKISRINKYKIIRNKISQNH